MTLLVVLLLNTLHHKKDDFINMLSLPFVCGQKKSESLFATLSSEHEAKRKHKPKHNHGASFQGSVLCILVGGTIPTFSDRFYHQLNHRTLKMSGVIMFRFTFNV